MQIHVGLGILFPGRCTNVSDTYVVSDPCITTQHEFGTNSVRTQHELFTLFTNSSLLHLTVECGQFCCFYRVAEGRPLINTETDQ